MEFKELNIGDTFTCEELYGDCKYIKIEYVLCQLYEHPEKVGNKKIKMANAVCIDEHSQHKGQLRHFGPCKNVSHVNWS